MDGNSRKSWDETWLEVAHAAAKRSLCTRAQVGCVIVDADNRILATGYNNPPRGFEHGDSTCGAWCLRARSVPDALRVDYADCPSLHAESNALVTSDHTSRRRGSLYVTSHVCFPCGKMIANSGIETVVVQPDGAQAHRRPEETYAFMERCGLTVVIYEPR